MQLGLHRARGRFHHLGNFVVFESFNFMQNKNRARASRQFFKTSFQIHSRQQRHHRTIGRTVIFPAQSRFLEQLFLAQHMTKPIPPEIHRQTRQPTCQASAAGITAQAGPGFDKSILGQGFGIDLISRQPQTKTVNPVDMLMINAGESFAITCGRSVGQLDIQLMLGSRML